MQISSAQEAHHSLLMDRFPLILSCCLLDSIGREGADIGLDLEDVTAVDNPEISDWSLADSLLISDRSSDNDLLT